jgi:hypothetical protein
MMKKITMMKSTGKAAPSKIKNKPTMMKASCKKK